MNSKGLKSVFFILILLASKVGLAINVHYCCGQISEISMAWDAEGCQMQPIMDHSGFVIKKIIVVIIKAFTFRIIILKKLSN